MMQIKVISANCFKTIEKEVNLFLKEKDARFMDCRLQFMDDKEMIHCVVEYTLLRGKQ